MVDPVFKNQEFDCAELFLALHMARKAQWQWHRQPNPNCAGYATP